MIQVVERKDLDEVNERLMAICRHLKIKIISAAACGPITSTGLQVVTDWPFVGGFPPEPLIAEGEKKI